MAKAWPPPAQDGKIHSLYTALQNALEEEVELPPAHKAADVVRGMKNVGSRWKAGATAQLQPPLRAQPSSSTCATSRGKATAASAPDAAPPPPSPPHIAVPHRAVHPMFLRELLKRGIPVPGQVPTWCTPGAAAAALTPQATAAERSSSIAGSTPRATRSGVSSFAGSSRRVSTAQAGGGGSSSGSAQDWVPAGWTTAELVARSIKPATQPAHASLVQSVVCGAVSLPWCPEGRFQGPEFEAERLQGQPVYGSATFFVSFSHAYKFEELVSAILLHYAGLPAATNGSYPPVYYWISAFAINLNHGHDIRKNPEAMFESTVLPRCRALLLACKPWFAPAALTRTWCLYECLVAITMGIELVALNLEHDIPLESIFDGGGIEHAQEAFAGALQELDVRNTHCSSKMDHAYLMSMIERHLDGPENASMVLALGLRPCLMSALLTLVLKRPDKDYSLAMQLVQRAEAHLQWGPAYVAGPWQGGDPAAEFFGAALQGSEVCLQELVLDPTVRPAHPSGSQGVLLTRPHNHLLGQEFVTAGSGPPGMAVMRAERGRFRSMAGTTVMAPPRATMSLEDGERDGGFGAHSTSGGSPERGASPARATHFFRHSQMEPRRSHLETEWTLGGWAS